MQRVNERHMASFMKAIIVVVVVVIIFYGCDAANLSPLKWVKVEGLGSLPVYPESVFISDDSVVRACVQLDKMDYRGGRLIQTGVCGEYRVEITDDMSCLYSEMTQTDAFKTCISKEPAYIWVPDTVSTLNNVNLCSTSAVFYLDVGWSLKGGTIWWAGELSTIQLGSWGPGTSEVEITIDTPQILDSVLFVGTGGAFPELAVNDASENGENVPDLSSTTSTSTSTSTTTQDPYMPFSGNPPLGNLFEVKIDYNDFNTIFLKLMRQDPLGEYQYAWFTWKRLYGVYSVCESFSMCKTVCLKTTCVTVIKIDPGNEATILLEQGDFPVQYEFKNAFEKGGLIKATDVDWRITSPVSTEFTLSLYHTPFIFEEEDDVLTKTFEFLGGSNNNLRFPVWSNTSWDYINSIVNNKELQVSYGYPSPIVTHWSLFEKNSTIVQVPNPILFYINSNAAAVPEHYLDCKLKYVGASSSIPYCPVYDIPVDYAKEVSGVYVPPWSPPSEHTKIKCRDQSSYYLSFDYPETTVSSDSIPVTISVLMEGSIDYTLEVETPNTMLPSPYTTSQYIVLKHATLITIYNVTRDHNARLLVRYDSTPRFWSKVFIEESNLRQPAIAPYVPVSCQDHTNKNWEIEHATWSMWWFDIGFPSKFTIWSQEIFVTTTYSPRCFWVNAYINSTVSGPDIFRGDMIQILSPSNQMLVESVRLEPGETYSWEVAWNKNAIEVYMDKTWPLFPNISSDLVFRQRSCMAEYTSTQTLWDSTERESVNASVTLWSSGALDTNTNLCSLAPTGSPRNVQIYPLIQYSNKTNSELYWRGVYALPVPTKLAPYFHMNLIDNHDVYYGNDPPPISPGITEHLYAVPGREDEYVLRVFVIEDQYYDMGRIEKTLPIIYLDSSEAWENNVTWDSAAEWTFHNPIYHPVLAQHAPYTSTVDPPVFRCWDIGSIKKYSASYPWWQRGSSTISYNSDMEGEINECMAIYNISMSSSPTNSLGNINITFESATLADLKDEEDFVYPSSDGSMGAAMYHCYNRSSWTQEERARREYQPFSGPLPENSEGSVPNDIMECGPQVSLSDNNNTFAPPEYPSPMVGPVAFDMFVKIYDTPNPHIARGIPLDPRPLVMANPGTVQNASWSYNMSFFVPGNESTTMIPSSKIIVRQFIGSTTLFSMGLSPDQNSGTWDNFEVWAEWTDYTTNTTTNITTATLKSAKLPASLDDVRFYSNTFDVYVLNYSSTKKYTGNKEFFIADAMQDIDLEVELSLSHHVRFYPDVTYKFYFWPVLYPGSVLSAASPDSNITLINAGNYRPEECTDIYHFSWDESFGMYRFAEDADRETPFVRVIGTSLRSDDLYITYGWIGSTFNYTGHVVDKLSLFPKLKVSSVNFNGTKTIAYLSVEKDHPWDTTHFPVAKDISNKNTYGLAPVDKFGFVHMLLQVDLGPNVPFSYAVQMYNSEETEMCGRASATKYRSVMKQDVGNVDNMYPVVGVFDYAVQPNYTLSDEDARIPYPDYLVSINLLFQNQKWIGYANLSHPNIVTVTQFTQWPFEDDFQYDDLDDLVMDIEYTYYRNTHRASKITGNKGGSNLILSDGSMPDENPVNIIDAGNYLVMSDDSDRTILWSISDRTIMDTLSSTGGGRMVHDIGVDVLPYIPPPVEPLFALNFYPVVYRINAGAYFPDFYNSTFGLNPLSPTSAKYVAPWSSSDWFYYGCDFLPEGECGVAIDKVSEIMSITLGYGIPEPQIRVNGTADTHLEADCNIDWTYIDRFGSNATLIECTQNISGFDLVTADDTVDNIHIDLEESLTRELQLVGYNWTYVGINSNLNIGLQGGVKNDCEWHGIPCLPTQKLTSTSEIKNKTYFGSIDGTLSRIPEETNIYAILKDARETTSFNGIGNLSDSRFIATVRGIGSDMNQTSSIKIYIYLYDAKGPVIPPVKPHSQNCPFYKLYADVHAEGIPEPGTSYDNTARMLFFGYENSKGGVGASLNPLGARYAYRLPITIKHRFNFTGYVSEWVDPDNLPSDIVFRLLKLYCSDYLFVNTDAGVITFYRVDATSNVFLRSNIGVEGKTLPYRNVQFIRTSIDLSKYKTVDMIKALSLWSEDADIDWKNKLDSNTYIPDVKFKENVPKDAKHVVDMASKNLTHNANMAFYSQNKLIYDCMQSPSTCSLSNPGYFYAGATLLINDKTKMTPADVYGGGRYRVGNGYKVFPPPHSTNINYMASVREDNDYDIWPIGNREGLGNGYNYTTPYLERYFTFTTVVHPDEQLRLNLIRVHMVRTYIKKTPYLVGHKNALEPKYMNLNINLVSSISSDSVPPINMWLSTTGFVISNTRVGSDELFYYFGRSGGSSSNNNNIDYDYDTFVSYLLPNANNINPVPGSSEADKKEYGKVPVDLLSGSSVMGQVSKTMLYNDMLPKVCLDGYQIISPEQMSTPIFGSAVSYFDEFTLDEDNPIFGSVAAESSGFSLNDDYPACFFSKENRDQFWDAFLKMGGCYSPPTYYSFSPSCIINMMKTTWDYTYDVLRSANFPLTNVAEVPRFYPYASKVHSDYEETPELTVYNVYVPENDPPIHESEIYFRASSDEERRRRNSNYFLDDDDDGVGYKINLDYFTEELNKHPVIVYSYVISIKTDEC